MHKHAHTHKRTNTHLEDDELEVHEEEEERGDPRDEEDVAVAEVVALAADRKHTQGLCQHVDWLTTHTYHME
jgi:hypothetical protein